MELTIGTNPTQHQSLLSLKSIPLEGGGQMILTDKAELLVTNKNAYRARLVGSA